MASKRNASSVPRTIALCYVRQSLTRGEDDMASPERQKANIREVCAHHGWTPEFFMDAEGHKSGRKVENRPMWLSLEARLQDPNVAALVANDLSRMHRSTWRVGELVDRLERLGVRLIQAAPGREIDTSTPMGKMMITFIAMQDESYANDIAQRAKDSVQYRQKRGISIGMPPFGTKRDENGFLIPTDEGAWLLPNGKLVKGSLYTPPVDGAIWRGYYQATLHILTLYATGKYGVDKLAQVINEETWAYRSRNGEPRRFERDDIRRIIPSWPAYGGVVQARSAKDHPGYQVAVDIDTFPFKPERAVFEIPLLKKVAKTYLERSVAPPDDKVKRDSYPYALSMITYCAHCETLAHDYSSLKYRTALTGCTFADGVRRYKHRTGVKCGCTNRTVTAKIIESEIARLLDLMSVGNEVLPHLLALAEQFTETEHGRKATVEFENEKKAAIAKCHRKLRTALEQYEEGEIERQEYLARKEKLERDLAEWDRKTSQIEQVKFEMNMCIGYIHNMIGLWKGGSPEQRKDLARALFDHIVYDLDSQRIVSFKLSALSGKWFQLKTRRQA